MDSTKYRYRMVARVTLEAVSPLALGSGVKDILTDAPVAKDLNGLPYIPGSSLAGVIRHGIQDEKLADEVFGFQRGADGLGSRLILSDALFVGSDGRAVEELCDIRGDEYLRRFAVLPIRQHVRLTDKGTAADHGKFDEQVVYRGARFVFDMELLSETHDDSVMRRMLAAISSPTFRLGGGTRNGFGSMKVVGVQYACYDLTESDSLNAYLQKPSSLAEEWNGGTELHLETAGHDGWVKYRLEIRPCDFFLFSSGYGDDDADITPVTEDYVDWECGRPIMRTGCCLIPATSVKGAIAHRTAYHWNRLNRRFVDLEPSLTADGNQATVRIFGTAEGPEPRRGEAIFSDVMLENMRTKVLPHIRVDKFTGGVIDGAFFQEKTTDGCRQDIVEEIFVSKAALADPLVRQAFEKALGDICAGLLPLGGGTNRGNGTFVGTLKIEE